ncbi:MAG: lysoplasmalogenase [Rhodobacteraceae bacterium]|nr:lysoplasmalogenase [Paracoccaceae bacterium]
MIDSLALPAAAVVIFTSAAIYGFGVLNAEISHWRSFWKTLPVAIMALFVAVFGGWLLALALALSAIGDYLLSRDEDKFTIGLVSFLSAHLIYIWLFQQLVETVSFGWGQAAMVVYALVYGSYLWPRAGDFRIPVLAYVFVITVMVASALMLPSGYLLVVFGSLSFAVSDSVLALEMFVITKKEVRVALSKVVWVSYIAAQGLLVIGLYEIP